MAQGRFGPAAAQLIALARDGALGAGDVRSAGMAALRAGRTPDFFAVLVPAAQTLGITPFDYCHEVGWHLFHDDGHEALLDGLRQCPDAPLLQLSFLYFAACVFFARGNNTDAFAMVHAFRRAAFARLADLPFDNGSFHVMFRQMILVEDARYLADPDFTRNAQGFADKLPPIEWHSQPAGTGAVIVSCCDSRYLELFGETFLASADTAIADRSDIHLHVVDPSSETEAWLARQADQRRHRLSWSTASSGALKSSVFYASSRFIRMPEFLAAWQRPVLALDIDCEFVASPAPVAKALEGADAVMFEKPDHTGPCSRFPAALTGFAPTAGGRALADFLGRYILSKLGIMAELLWLLDQGALFTAATLAGDLPETPAIANLTESHGLTFRDFVKTQESDVSKLELMIAASQGDD